MTQGDKLPKNPKIKKILAWDKNFVIFKFGQNLYQIDLLFLGLNLLLGLTLLLGLNPIENTISSYIRYGHQNSHLYKELRVNSLTLTQPLGMRIIHQIMCFVVSKFSHVQMVITSSTTSST